MGQGTSLCDGLSPPDGRIEEVAGMSDILGTLLGLAILLVIAALAFTAVYELFELFHPLIHG